MDRPDEVDLCPWPTFLFLTETMRSAARELDGEGVALMLEAYIKKCSLASSVGPVLNPSLYMAGGEAVEKMQTMAEKALAFILAARAFEDARSQGRPVAEKMGFRLHVDAEPTETEEVEIDGQPTTLVKAATVHAVSLCAGDCKCPPANPTEC